MWSGLWAFGGAPGAAKRSETLKNGVKSEENRAAATQYEIDAISELVEWLSDYALWVDYALVDDFKEKTYFCGK